MAEKEKNNKTLPKKSARWQIEKMLETNLHELEQLLGRKKFQRRIRKASRLLTEGLPKGKKNKKDEEKSLVWPVPTRPDLIVPQTPSEGNRLMEEF
jgi:hypothetical protein